VACDGRADAKLFPALVLTIGSSGGNSWGKLLEPTAILRIL